MTNKGPADLTAGTTIAAGDLCFLLQGSDTELTSNPMSAVKTFTTTPANQLSVFAAGTAYSLTTTAAKLDFGTTDPVKTVSAAGTYKITASVTLNYNAATFAAVRTITLKLRRTNNTAADLTNSSRDIKTQIVTTLTGTLMVITWSPDYYTTLLTNDSIEIWGSIDTGPTAGSLDAVAASLHFERLQQ